MNNEKNSLRIKLSVCMLLWGSIGLITRYIGLSAFELAFFRAFFALPVLFLSYRIRGSKGKTTYKVILPYAASGMLIAIAWVALFLGYRYTTISTAVLVYNMCPVYVMILSPLLLKEKLDQFQVLTIIGCFFGLSLLIGTNSVVDKDAIKGISFAFLSGLLYAVVVLLNRKISLSSELNTVDPVYATFIQLCAATLVLLPYQITHNSFYTVIHLGLNQLFLLAVLGVVHTGFAYYFYFTTYRKLEALEIVSFSFLEPLFGILLSVLFLGEHMGIGQLAGGVLILTLTYLNEYRKSRLAIRATVGEIEACC
ncbi:DMT(drug/metabolite transporter) superfamily permease [Sphaerochaeta pleomorpha str. Grapes]|uniref:DMT(Drug/metabolite transporter) superfamily permease n=2 Tax=Sphaerochaeta TaxID=399320 RepID=G8QWS0_SPHPG|nr:DMT(drug/metabolite transporter) superfamily permease [Sphaerochaeta pleomorpha str. Grapes]